MGARKKQNTKKSLWSPARIAATVVVLSLIAAFGLTKCNSTDERRANPAPPSANNESRGVVKNAPPAALTSLPSNIVDAELKTVNGAPIKLSNYSGKVLILNLWATWCGPCRQETPELVKLYKEFRQQGLEVIGLSTENPDASAQLVRNFVRDFNVSYTIGWATPQVSVTLMQGREAIPQSFVIARDGRIVKRFVGFNALTTPPQIKQAIQDALNNKTTAD